MAGVLFLFLRLNERRLASIILRPYGEMNPIAALLASLDARASDIHRTPRQVVARCRSAHCLIHLRRAITDKIEAPSAPLSQITHPVATNKRRNRLILWD